MTKRQLFYVLNFLVLDVADAEPQAQPVLGFVAGEARIGVELVTVDTYIAELVPKHVRGRAFAYNQVVQFMAVPTVAFLAWHAWRDADQGSWPPGYPEAGRVSYDLPTIRRWLDNFLYRFFI